MAEPPCPLLLEEALWKAVIIQAIYDAVRYCRKPHHIHCRDAARRWLTEGSNDFVDVCLWANLDPNDVRKKAKKALLNPDIWRTRPGQSERYLERQERRARRKKKRTAERKPTPPAPGCIIINAFA